MNPYDRLPQESDPAWSAFQTFRDLGVDRSLPRVAESCTKSVSLMKGRYGWHRVARPGRAGGCRQGREWGVRSTPS